VSPGPLPWSVTRARLRADRARLSGLLEAAQGAPPRFVSLHPSFVCVLLHRLSHHHFRAGRRHLARLFWHANVVITGADISPPADLGEGLVVMSPPGTAVSGKAGRNLTLMPLAGLGGEVGRRDDVGAGPGLPVLGDDVVMEPNCGVLGPVRVGSRVRIGAAVAVTQDVPDDTIAAAHRPRLVRRRDL
jgi:serine O-acetyltransferase